MSLTLVFKTYTNKENCHGFSPHTCIISWGVWRRMSLESSRVSHLQVLRLRSQRWVIGQVWSIWGRLQDDCSWTRNRELRQGGDGYPCEWSMVISPPFKTRTTKRQQWQADMVTYQETLGGERGALHISGLWKTVVSVSTTSLSRLCPLQPLVHIVFGK